MKYINITILAYFINLQHLCDFSEVQFKINNFFNIKSIEYNRKIQVEILILPLKFRKKFESLNLKIFSFRIFQRNIFKTYQKFFI